MAVRARLAGMVAVCAVVVAVSGAGATPAHAAGGVASGAVGAHMPIPVPDTGAGGQWWFTTWQIPKVWELGAQGQGITVAVLDSGVSAARQELAGVVLPGTDFAGGDGRTDTGALHGHGTGMAVFIAGQGPRTGTFGVAPPGEDPAQHDHPQPSSDCRRAAPVGGGSRRQGDQHLRRERRIM